MSDQQKISLQSSLNRVGMARAADAIRILGKALPCSVVSRTGQIATVKFELNTNFTLPQITLPIFGAEYIRLPIKAGDKGVVFPVDAGIGHISGLGAATPPDMTAPGNLSALVFCPIGNKNWASVSDPNAVTIYGPNGVVLEDTNGQSSIKVQPGSVVILAAGVSTSTGIVTKECICSFTGAPHPMSSINNKASL